MKTSDLARLALQFLARRKSRTLLTVSGVIIGTLCITLMISIGISNYASLRSAIEDNALLTEIRVSASEEQLLRGGLTDADVADMAALTHVKAASPIVTVPGTLKTGPYEAYVNLTGVSADVLAVPLAEGHLYEPGGASAQLVVGGNAVRDFVDPAHPPDYDDWEAYMEYAPDIDWLEAPFTFSFGYPADEEDESAMLQSELNMRVCGVTEAAETADASSLFIDLTQARKILLDHADEAQELDMGILAVNEAVVRVESMEYVEAVLEELRNRGYDARSETEYIKEMQAEQSRQLLQLLLIGLVSLAVSAIGIANTMYAGILERRRDIGIMKVLGMKSGRIKMLFVTEAALIGLVGGLIGLGLTAVITGIINASMASGSILGMYFTEGEKISIPIWVAAGGVGAACLTGILSGLWPAAKASRLSPLEAMRSGN